MDLQVLVLAFLEHLEHEAAAQVGIVGVAEVLVHALLERVDAAPQLFGVVGGEQFLEDGARVRGAGGERRGGFRARG